MKLYLYILFSLISVAQALCQGNRVFTGGEMSNYGLVDISAVDGISWSTDRLALPGYYIAFETANIIGCKDSLQVSIT